MKELLALRHPINYFIGSWILVIGDLVNTWPNKRIAASNPLQAKQNAVSQPVPTNRLFGILTTRWIMPTVPIRKTRPKDAVVWRKGALV